MGFPSPAADHADLPLDLHTYLVIHPAATFFWRYSGTDMDRAGIQHGALLVIDRALDVTPGDVIAVIHRGEGLIRRLVKEGRRYRLATAPLEGRPVLIDVEEETVIWGAVTHVVNHLKAGAVRPGRYGDVSDGMG